MHKILPIITRPEVILAEFIQENKKKPFFLYLAYHAIHSPFDAKTEYLEKYKKSNIRKEEDIEYAATVEALDENIGRLHKKLVSLNLKNNTYIFKLCRDRLNGRLSQTL